MEIPPRRAPDEMIRAERRALLRAVTTKALREADREVVRTPLTRKSDVRFRGQTGKRVLILSLTASNPLLTPSGHSEAFTQPRDGSVV